MFFGSSGIRLSADCGSERTTGLEEGGGGRWTVDLFPGCKPLGVVVEQGSKSKDVSSLYADANQDSSCQVGLSVK